MQLKSRFRARNCAARRWRSYFEKLPPTLIAIEACGGSHHWARRLRSIGHEVKLIPPQYVKRGKNDSADAEALCEAMSRPTMRFVPVKTPESQAVLMLIGLRDRLVRNRVQLANAILGYAAEFGLTAARGMGKIDPLLERIAADQTLPAQARELFGLHAKEYGQLQGQLKEIEAKLTAWRRADECSRRLARIPGVGPVGASMLVMRISSVEGFRSARHLRRGSA
jgi:transposase